MGDEEQVAAACADLSLPTELHRTLEASGEENVATPVDGNPVANLVVLVSEALDPVDTLQALVTRGAFAFVRLIGGSGLCDVVALSWCTERHAGR